MHFFLDIIFHSAPVFELCREDSTQVGCFRYESRQCFNSLCSINIFLDNTWYLTAVCEFNKYFIEGYLSAR